MTNLITGDNMLRSSILAALNWSNDDIAEVARYLNILHYHYPAPN